VSHHPRNHGTWRYLMAILTAFALLAAACGDDSSGDEDDSADASDATQVTADDAYPVTIEHTFGETTIDEAPERIVTVGWGSTEAAIALGVYPVLIPFDDYAGDEEGILPWIREALDAADQPIPDTYPDTEGPAAELIAAAQPDLILAPYSGIDEEQYEVLSQIAPTVAYPGEAWSTPWRDVITIVGEALGDHDGAEQILADIDAEVAAAAESHPEFEGLTVAQVWDTGDAFYVYKEADPRVGFTLDLGFAVPESLEALQTDESTFYFTLSYEQLGELTSDVIVSYADDAAASEAFLTSDPAQLMAQVRGGAVAEMIGPERISAVSPPNALSLPWGLDDYVASLAEAVAALDAG
jgi:iron complex transport system substrate-binding protein